MQGLEKAAVRDTLVAGACARAERIFRSLAALFCLLALAVLVGCLGDYEVNWMHPEIFAAESKHFAGFTELHWRDFLEFLNCRALSDTCLRARFLSYLTGYVNSAFRLYVAGHLVPHPSLSLTWPLSFLSIYLFYRLILALTGDRAAGLLTTGLYVLSAGFLSMMLMLFNPAKPLTNFFVNLTLYLAARIWRSGDRRALSAKAVSLYVALFLAYCSDETAWVLYGAIPILFPELFRRRSWPLALCLLLTYPAFLAFVTWLAPAAISYFWGYAPFDFWGFLLNAGRRARPTELSYIERLGLGALWHTAVELVESQYAWWRSGPAIATLSLLPLAAGLAAAVAFARRRSRMLFIRTAIMLAAFVVFQGLVLLRGGNVGVVSSGTYYYGALFSNFSLLLIGSAVSCFRAVPAARFACLFASLYVGYVSFSWCMAFNHSWIARHDRIYAEQIDDRFGRLTLGAPLSEAKVAAYWRAVRAGANASSLQAAFAPKDAWLFLEMESWRRLHSPAHTAAAPATE